MSYTPTIWVDQSVETPNTYSFIENPDGTKTLVEVTGDVYAEGTPVNASNLNKMETELVSIETNKVDKASIVNNGVTTVEGTVLDGRMGKTLQDQVTTINTNLTINYGTCRTYSASATYALNALVIYNNRLYKCTTAITVAEAWNAAHWTAIADTNNGTVYNTTDSSFYGIRGADSVAKKLGSGNIAIANNFSTGNTTITVQATATAKGKASLYFGIVASSVWGSVTVKHNNNVLYSGSNPNWTTQGAYIVDCEIGDTLYVSVYGNGLECGVITYPVV